MLYIISLFISFSLFGQEISILSWNIRDFGKTKNESEINSIATIVFDNDIICIQEVVAEDPGGAQAVARLADRLNRMGTKWDYRVSDPTGDPSPQKRERYAFLWKSSKITMIGRPYIDKQLDDACVREPFIAKFKIKQTDSEFFIVNFHSRRYNENPEEEVQHFSNYPNRLGSSSVIIAGDFNLDENHSVFDELYGMGYSPVIKKSPTTLKRKCDGKGNYLNHAIDNIYYPGSMELVEGKIIDFIQDCDNVRDARFISDHVPVVCRLSFTN